MKLPEGLQLAEEDNGLTLTDGKLSLTADLSEMLPRLRRGNLESELLVKATKIKGVEHLLVVDATAGLGQDSLLLAASGYRVILFEYDEVIAALLTDSLKRATTNPELSEIVERMELRQGDSVVGMRAFSGEGIEPDVVFLDPMFPGRTKSGLIKKKFQLLQRLESPCADEESLMEAAKACNPRKIVIKRPLKGPFLAGVKPSYSLQGKAIRYDVIVFPERMPGKAEDSRKGE